MAPTAPTGTPSLRLDARAGALPVVLAIFFTSGFAALLYQVIWQRLLVIFSGVDVHSVTIIVAAFMAGLGSGSLAGGRIADRSSARASVWMFAGAELMVGLFAVISKWLYYDVLYGRFPQLAGAPAIAAPVLLVALLWPTFFMGLSLPLLARAFTLTLAASGRITGSLYGWNTLGAATGAFASTWILLPRFGLEKTLWIGAGLNLVCAASAAWLVTRFRPSPAAAVSATVLEDAATDSDRLSLFERPLSFRWWASLYAFSGFVALALEIAWFRMLGVMLKSTAFTFGTLLALYLSGIGLGAAIGSRTVTRSRRPGTTFLVAQYGLTLYAACALMAFLALLGSGQLADLVHYFGGHEALDLGRGLAILHTRSWSDASARTAFFQVVVLYAIVPALLIGPATFLMGFGFPYLQKAAQSDLSRYARRVGTLLAANIAGSTIGAMAAGWVLLPLLGTAGTLKVLVGLGAILVWPFIRVRRGRASLAALLTGVAALTMTAVVVSKMPSGRELWSKLHSTSPKQVLLAEDGSGLSVLKSQSETFGGLVTVFVNGLSQSWIPYGNIHTTLGALPLFIHPSPHDVAIIGLGSGDTAFSAAGRPEVQRLVCIELIAAQIGTLSQLARLQSYPGLVSLLSDPRIEHRVGDGRAYILHEARRFDLIEADALRPSTAYSGNLYSREYFDLLRRHLAPGGFAVTWAPTDRIRRTFVDVFPYVLGFRDIYIGSDRPIAFDPAVVSARAAAAHSYYAAAGIDISALLDPYLKSNPERYDHESKRTIQTDLNTDTFPRDELALPF